MLDLMYHLPEEPKPGDYTVTPEVIEGEVHLFEEARRKKKESA